MNKRVGFLGLMIATAVTLFTPAVASAQDRDDYHHGYAREYRDRDWRRDDRQRDERREWRERQEWRERAEWRERERYERPYYSQGFRGPDTRFGFSWYGR